MARDHPPRDDLAALLLGAAEPREERRLGRHLSRCRDCRAELRWLEPVVGVLAESVEQVEPPPALRARIMAGVAEQGAGPPGARRARREPRRRLGAALRPAAGLAALALLGAGAAGYLLHSDGSRTETFAAAPARFEAGLEVDGDSATLIAKRLPPLRRGDVYQVWAAWEGGPVRASSYFVPRADGSGAAAVPEVLEGADEVMVTRERRPAAGPQAAPRTAPVLDVKTS